jgi:hypothetical protein
MRAGRINGLLKRIGRKVRVSLRCLRLLVAE